MDEETTRRLFEVALSHGEQTRMKRLTKANFKQFFRSAGLFDGSDQQQQQQNSNSTGSNNNLGTQNLSASMRGSNRRSPMPPGGNALVSENTMVMVDENKDQDVEGEGVSNLFLQMLWEEFRALQEEERGSFLGSSARTNDSNSNPFAPTPPTSVNKSRHGKTAGESTQPRPFSFLPLMDACVADAQAQSGDEKVFSPPNVRRQLDMRPNTAETTATPPVAPPKAATRQGAQRRNSLIRTTQDEEEDARSDTSGGPSSPFKKRLRTNAVWKQRQDRDFQHFLKQEYMEYEGFHCCIQAITQRRYLSIIGRPESYRLTPIEVDQSVRIMKDQYFNSLLESCCVTPETSTDLRQHENTWLPLTHGLVLKILDACNPLFLEAFQDQINTDIQLLGGTNSCMVLTYKHFRKFLGLYGLSDGAGTQGGVEFGNHGGFGSSSSSAGMSPSASDDFSSQDPAATPTLFHDTRQTDPLISDDMALAIFSAANTQDTKGLDKGQLDNELEIDEFVKALLMIALAAFDGHHLEHLSPSLLPPRLAESRPKDYRPSIFAGARESPGGGAGLMSKETNVLKAGTQFILSGKRAGVANAPGGLPSPPPTIDEEELLTIQGRVFAFADYFAHAHRVLRPSSKCVTEAEEALQELRYTQEHLLEENQLKPYVGAVEPSKFCVEGDDLLLVGGLNFLDVKENPDALREKREQQTQRQRVHLLRSSSVSPGIDSDRLSFASVSPTPSVSAQSVASSVPPPPLMSVTAPESTGPGSKSQSVRPRDGGGSSMADPSRTTNISQYEGSLTISNNLPRSQAKILDDSDVLEWPKYSAAYIKRRNKSKESSVKWSPGDAGDVRSVLKKAASISAQARKVFSVAALGDPIDEMVGNATKEPIWVWFGSYCPIPGYHQAQDRVTCNPPAELLVPTETLNSDRMVFSKAHYKNEPRIADVHYLLDIAPPLIQSTGDDLFGSVPIPQLNVTKQSSTFSQGGLGSPDNLLSPTSTDGGDLNIRQTSIRPTHTSDSQGFCLGFSLSKMRSMDVGVTKSQLTKPRNTAPVLLQLRSTVQYLSTPHRELLEMVYKKYSKLHPPVVKTIAGGLAADSVTDSITSIERSKILSGSVFEASARPRVPDAWSLNTFLAFIEDHQESLPARFALPSYLEINDRACRVDGSSSNTEHHYFENTPESWEKLFYTFAYNSERLTQESAVQGLPDRAVPAAQVVTSIQTNVYGVAFVHHSCPRIRKKPTVKRPGPPREEEGISWTATNHHKTDAAFRVFSPTVELPSGSAGWLLTRSGLLLLLGYALIGVALPEGDVKTGSSTAENVGSLSTPTVTSGVFDSRVKKQDSYDPPLSISNANVTSPDFEAFIVRLLRSPADGEVIETFRQYEDTLRRYDNKPIRPPGEPQKHGSTKRQAASDAKKGFGEVSSSFAQPRGKDNPLSKSGSPLTSLFNAGKKSKKRKAVAEKENHRRIVQAHKPKSPPPRRSSATVYGSHEKPLPGASTNLPLLSPSTAPAPPLQTPNSARATPGPQSGTKAGPTVPYALSPQFLKQFENRDLKGPGIEEVSDSGEVDTAAGGAGGGNAPGVTPLRNWFKRPKVRDQAVAETSSQVLSTIKKTYLQGIMTNIVPGPSPM